MDTPVTKTGCPGGVKAAAWIWCLIGVLQLLTVALVVAMTKGGPRAAQEVAPSSQRIIMGILLGVLLIMAGRQTLKGKAPDTRGNGIASIIIGVLSLVFGYASLKSFREENSLPDPVMLGFLVSAAVGMLGGLLLLLAGALALAGRERYLAWWSNRPSSI